MKRRSRPSPALRAGRARRSGGGVGAAVAVPLLRKRLRIPAPVTIAACAAGPLAAGRPAPALAQARRRPLRDADVGLHDGPRASLRRPGAAARPPAHPLPDRRRPRRSALGRLPNVRLQRGLARLPPGRRAQPLPHLGPLALVLRALPGPGLHPAPPPRALPARRAADGRGLRHRLRRLLRGADRAALVGLRAGPSPAREVRRIMVEVGEETWGSAWPAMYEALGGNPWAAMPSLHFATSVTARDLARRSGPRPRARSAGPTR